MVALNELRGLEVRWAGMPATQMDAGSNGQQLVLTWGRRDRQFEEMEPKVKVNGNDKDRKGAKRSRRRSGRATQR